MSDRLSEIEERLAHEDEPCCDHSGRDEHGCWDCRNTGHAHAPYVEGEAKSDLAALVKFAREVVDALDAWVSDPVSTDDARSRAIERIDRATELIGEDWKP